MSAFQAAKVALIETLDMSRDALHVWVGLGVFLGAAIIFRRSLRDWLPIGATLLAALAGEVWDLIDDARFGHELDWCGNWHDLIGTLFWPLLLFLLARFTRVLRR